MIGRKGVGEKKVASDEWRVARRIEKEGPTPTRVARKSIRDTPPPVFWKKRLQAVENTRSECEKAGERDAKRRQVAETLRVRGGAMGAVCEVCSR